MRVGWTLKPEDKGLTFHHVGREVFAERGGLGWFEIEILVDVDERASGRERSYPSLVQNQRALLGSSAEALHDSQSG